MAGDHSPYDCKVTASSVHILQCNVLVILLGGAVDPFVCKIIEPQMMLISCVRSHAAVFLSHNTAIITGVLLVQHIQLKLCIFQYIFMYQILMFILVEQSEPTIFR